MQAYTLSLLIVLLANSPLALAADPTAAEPSAAPVAADATPQAADTSGETPDAAYAAEQRLATDLRRTAGAGEQLTLQVEGKEVLALYVPQSRGRAEGAVLLLHDLNAHPDWPGVIAPLRTALPEAGWHSLSLQLPHVAASQPDLAYLDAARPRISAALAELGKRGIGNIVLIGHGSGALAAIDFLGANLLPEVQGLIIIGLDGSAHTEARLDAAAAIARLTIPLLDIYGERDLRAAQSARRRYTLSHRNAETGEVRTGYADVARHYSEKKGLELDYRQIGVSGADRQFGGQQANLVKRLRGWLKRYASGSEIKSQNTPENPQ